MWTGNPNGSPAARNIAPRSLQVLTLAALVGLAPIAASSASASDAPAAPAVETKAAMIEMVPIQPSQDVSATTPSIVDAAPSSPQETVVGRGSASYYAAKFDGRRTASGERFSSAEMTAAHRTLPFGTMVRVTNVATGKSVVVRINDRGPFSAGRMIDVSRAAAEELGLVARGHGTVELAVIEG